MKIRRLILKNIRSFEERQIDFPDGSILLSGDVGSGKTTILLAIEFALFGLQPGQKGSALLRNDKNYGLVSLEMEIDAHKIKIERRLKRSQKSITTEYSSIIIDGIKNESSVTEIKTKVLSLLNYPEEFIRRNNILYRYTVYTPQEQMKQIILEDPEQRLNVLRYVFGIDRYRRIRENTQILEAYFKDKIKQLQLEVTGLEEDNEKFRNISLSIKELQTLIEQKNKELKEANKKRKELEIETTQLESKIKEKENFEKEIEKTKILIVSKRENIIMIEKEIADYKRSISDEIIFNQLEYDKVIDAINNIKQQIDQDNQELINMAGNFSSLEKDKENIYNQKQRINSLKICPTCLQEVADLHKHSISVQADIQIKKLNDELEHIKDKKNLLLLRLEDKKRELRSLEELKTEMEAKRTKAEFFQKSRQRIQELEKILSANYNDINLLSAHINNLKENILNYAKFDNLYKMKKEELRKFIEHEKRIEISIAELNKEKEIIIKELTNLKEIIRSKTLKKEELSKTLEFLNWFSNQFLSLINFVEKNIMLKLRAEFSRLFNSWFHMLAGDSMEVRLDENFTPIIIQEGIEMDYSFLSGGERTAIALAYRLSLNQTINSVLSQIKTKDIVILDEPTEGFSEAQVDKIRDVLQELKVGQLIIVSHEPKIEGFVDCVIKIKKQQGVSLLEEPISHQTQTKNEPE